VHEPNSHTEPTTLQHRPTTLLSSTNTLYIFTHTRNQKRFFADKEPTFIGLRIGDHEVEIRASAKVLGLENHLLQVHNRYELPLDRDRVIVSGALELVVDSHGSGGSRWRTTGCAPAHPICAGRPEFVEISGVYLITGCEEAHGWPRLRSGLRQQRRDGV